MEQLDQLLASGLTPEQIAELARQRAAEKSKADSLALMQEITLPELTPEKWAAVKAYVLAENEDGEYGPAVTEALYAILTDDQARFFHAGLVAVKRITRGHSWLLADAKARLQAEHNTGEQP